MRDKREGGSDVIIIAKIRRKEGKKIHILPSTYSDGWEELRRIINMRKKARKMGR